MKDSQSALLLALASAKRIGDLHAFSVDSDCIHFGPGDCGVTLWPRITCLKSLSTPFRTQTVSLSALSSESSTSRDANAQISVCPVRVLRIYIDRSASFRQSDQLSCVLRWLCEGPYQNRGFPLDCGRYHGCLYEPRLECPFHIRVYSTRVIASCAWLRGMSIQEICFAAGWSSQVLQAGRSVLGLLSAVGEWLIHVYATSIHMCLLPHTVITLCSPLCYCCCCLPCTQCSSSYTMYILLVYHHVLRWLLFNTVISVQPSQCCCFCFCPVSQRSIPYYWPDMQISYTWALDAHWLISTYQLRARLQASLFVGIVCVFYLR